MPLFCWTIGGKNMQVKPFLLVVLGGAILLFLVTLLVFQFLSRRNQGAGSVREYEQLRQPGKGTVKQTLHRFLQQLYLFCEQVRPLRVYMATIRRRLTLIHPYEEWKLRLETMKISLAAWGLLVVIALPLSIFARDPLSFLMGFIILWVGHGIVADVFIHRLENRLLHQLRHLITDIRHYFHRHGMVEEAFYDAAEAAPYEMALHGKAIYEVLMASDPEDELEHYYEVAPNRFLKGLAGISHLVREYGDKTLQTGSLYLKALERLTMELNLDILRREKLSYLLQGLTAIALFPILCTRPIEKWASSTFPAMDAFYAGKLGWITKAVILLIILVSYILLRRMQQLDGEQTIPCRRPWEQRLYHWPGIRIVTERFMARPGSKEAERIMKLLKETRSPLKLEWFMLRRWMLAAGSLLLVLGLFISFHMMAKQQILNGLPPSELPFGRLAPEEQAKAQAASELDRQILQRIRGTKSHVRETIWLQLQQHSQLTEAELNRAAQRIQAKLISLDNEYLKWWEVLLAIVVGTGGYYGPLLMLHITKRLRQMDMKHEVDQFHTVIAMLSELDQVSVEQLLEWMERFALIFKEPLQQCLLHYEHGAEQALEQLKEEAPFMPLVRTVEKLQLAVEKIPIRQAFDDLEGEQAFAREQRKQDYEKRIDTKAGWGKMIGFTPMMALIFLYLVFPLVVISLSQMSVYYEQIQRIQ